MNILLIILALLASFVFGGFMGALFGYWGLIPAFAFGWFIGRVTFRLAFGDDNV